MVTSFGKTIEDQTEIEDTTSTDLHVIVQAQSDGTYQTKNVTDQNLKRARLISKTAGYTATAEDEIITVDATSGAITITLPTAAGIKGVRKTIKKIDASGNAVTVDGFSSETIDGAATAALAAQWDFITVVSDGTNWLIIATG